MPGQLQALHLPYSADNLNPHDQGIIWIREFGTETDPNNIGQAFQTNAGLEPQPPAIVNTRYGSLEISTMGQPAFASPMGQTFALPTWDKFPANLLVPELRTAVIYARFRLFKEPANVFDSGNPFGAYLILAGENFIGHQPIDPDGQFAALKIQPELGNPPTRTEDSLVVQEWESGGGVALPTAETIHPLWGNDIYVRIFAATPFPDPKTTGMEVEISRSGIPWTNLGLLLLEDVGLARIGLGVTGNCTAQLDWIRAYGYQPTSVDAIIEPPPPPTGGRLYLP